MTTTNEVALTIARQLGNITLSMLGARNLVSTENSLQFDIRGSKLARKIVIRLEPSDTYTIQFWSGRVPNIRKVSEVSDVHVESMHRVIQDKTGLFTRM